MTIMAEDLTTSDKADIAAYFASQKVMQGDGYGDNSVGNNLFINGDKDEEVPLDMAQKLISLSKTPSHEYIIKGATHDLDAMPQFTEEICKIVCSYLSPKTN